MSRVLYITNIPSPYRVEFFNELGKYVDLTVAFERRSSDERDDAWSKYNFTNFKGYFLKGKNYGVNMALSFGVCEYISSQKWDFIVCTDAYSPTGIIAIQYMKMKRIPYWIEGDGAFIGKTTGLKAAVKRYIYRKAEGVFSTGISHDNYYMAYGVSKDRIRRFNFSSLRRSDIIDAPLTEKEKKAYRIKLNISENKILLSVGQFIYRKGFDLLLKSAESIPEDIGIYIIGGKPKEEYISIVQEKGLHNVHFLDFMSKSSLNEYYKAADVFVFPTREDIWGLVVNEALAQGLPVISTDRCGAALELIKQGVNGYIVPADNEKELSKYINRIFDEDLEAMSREALSIIQKYSIEQMVKDHCIVFNDEQQ